MKRKWKRRLCTINLLTRYPFSWFFHFLLHSSQNGMNHFIPAIMEWTIPFQLEWNGSLAQMLSFNYMSNFNDFIFSAEWQNLIGPLSIKASNPVYQINVINPTLSDEVDHIKMIRSNCMQSAISNKVKPKPCKVRYTKTGNLTCFQILSPVIFLPQNFMPFLAGVKV